MTSASTTVSSPVAMGTRARTSLSPNKSRSATAEASQSWSARAVTWIKVPSNAPRLFNGLVAVGVAMAFLMTSKPVSFTEYAIDVGVHAFQAYYIVPKSSVYLKSAALGLNSARLVDIGIKLAHQSTIPYALNIFDIVNHSVNLAVTGYMFNSKAVKV